MDDNLQTNNQVPQFDPAATPAPPDANGAFAGAQSSPGVTVEPASQVPADDNSSLSDLESAVDEMTSNMDATTLPPPPFEPPQPVDPAAAPVDPAGMPPVDPVTEPPVSDPVNDAPVDDQPQEEPPVLSPDPDPSPDPEPEPEPDTEAINELLDANKMPENVNEIDSTLPQVNDPVPNDDTAANDESAESDEKQPEESKDNKKSKKSDKKPKDDLDLSNYDDTPVSYDELRDLKSQALEELAPIANELDQPAPERFKTLMELIQSTDNTHLVKPAFESAKAIEDEKARATALLSFVNEVEYLENKDKLDSEDDQGDSK